MNTEEALDIMLNIAAPNVISALDDSVENARQMEALNIVRLTRPFLATALKLAWQGAESKPVRHRQRALELGGG